MKTEPLTGHDTFGPPHPSDDDLLNLAHGFATAEPARSWLDHMRDCAPCEARFREFVGDRERLLWEPVPNPSAGPRRATPTVVDASRSKIVVRSWRWAVPIAAAAVLAIAVAPLFRHPSGPPRSDTTYWLPVEGEPALLRTRDAGTAQEALARALETYQSRDAKAALAALVELELPAGAEFESSMRRLYLASALVANQRPAEALGELARLDVPTMPEPWRRRARWVQYLALRDSGQAAPAATLLGDLAARDDEIGALARRERDQHSAH